MQAETLAGLLGLTGSVVGAAVRDEPLPVPTEPMRKARAIDAFAREQRAIAREEAER